MFSKEEGSVMDISNLLEVGGFWINLVSLLIALLGLGFGIWTYFKSKQRKLITYEFEDMNTNVVSIDRDKGENIKIFLDDQQVEEVRYQLIKIRNEGNVAIDDQDYKHPLQIFFAPQAVSRTGESSEIILRAGIPEAAPPLAISSSNAKDHIILDAENQYVALKDVLLNASDWIKIKVLTRGKADMVVKGQLRDGKIKPFVPTQSFLPGRKMVGYALLGALLFFLLYNSLGLIIALIQGNCAWGSIEVKGSSAFYDAAPGYARDYHTACPIGFVTVNQEPNASVSLTDLKNGAIQIAPSEMPASFAHSISSNFEDHQVAVIVFTVVVNKGVTGISSLSPEQLRGIYAGKYLKWNAVDNRAPDIPVTVFGRPAESGTYTTFTRYVLGLDIRVQPSAPTYQIAERTDLMAQAVAQTPGAIGYVDMRWAGRMSSAISPVEINGSAPTPALVENNAYPFWAIEHMYVNRNPDKLVTSFITYVTNHIETNDNFIKLQDMPINILQMRAAADNVTG